MCVSFLRQTLSNVVKTQTSTVKTVEGRRLASTPDPITVAVLRLVHELVCFCEYNGNKVEVS